MTEHQRLPSVSLAARVVLGLLFLYAASLKLVDLPTFASSIEGYRITPNEWSPMIALAVPSVEVVVGLALVAGLHARGAALLSAAMLIAFSAAIAQAMVRGINIDCGCFGASSPQKADSLALLRNSALLLLAMAVLAKPIAPWSRSRPES